MDDDDEDVKLIPRCMVCGGHADYWCKNKKTGEQKWFCEPCGLIIMLNYGKKDWEIIRLK